MAKPGVLRQSHPDAPQSPNGPTEWKYALSTHKRERERVRGMSQTTLGTPENIPQVERKGGSREGWEGKAKGASGALLSASC